MSAHKSDTFERKECPEHGDTLDPRAGWCKVCRSQPVVREYVAVDALPQGDLVRAHLLLREIRDGKHSIPGILVQIDRYLAGKKVGEP